MTSRAAISNRKPSSGDTEARVTLSKLGIAYSDALLTLLLLVLTFLSVKWVLSPRFFFLYDDWNFLYNAKIKSYSELFKFFPTQVYTDRPMGWVIYKSILSFVGSNHVAFHASFVLTHLLNVVLVFKIAKRILKDSICAFLGAILFGTTYQTQAAVGWTAAVFDVFATMFLLCSLYCYQKPGWKWTATSVLFYFLSMRTKEFGLFIPVILYLYDNLISHGRIAWKNQVEVLKRLAWHLLLTLTVAGRYFYLYIHSGASAVPGQYQQVVTLAEFYAGGRYYLGELFKPILTWTTVAVPSDVIAIVFPLGIAYALIRGNRAMLFGGLAFYVAILPVLFLKFHRQMLYMYGPMAFIGIYIGGAFSDFRSLALRIRNVSPHHLDTGLAVLLVALVSLSLRSDYRLNRVQFGLSKAGECYDEYLFMKENFPHPKSGTTFFISGLPKFFNVFDYGEGLCLATLYGDASLQCVIYRTEEDTIALCRAFRGPKHYLQFSNGHLESVPLPDEVQ